MFLPSKNSADAASSAELFVPMESAIEPILAFFRRSLKNDVTIVPRFAEGKYAGQVLDRPKVSETLQRMRYRNDSVTRQQKVLTGIKLIVLRRPQAYSCKII